MGESLKPAIVEFVGLPGAGKTTVFNAVVPRLQERNIPVLLRTEMLQEWRSHSPFEKLFHLVPTNQNQWNILFQSWNLALQTKPINLASFSKATKIFTNLKRLDSTEFNPFVLMDQGLLQEIWSVGITGAPPALTAIQSTLSLLFESRSIAIVHFKIDIDAAIKRIQSRSTQGSRFDQMSIESAQVMLLKYAPYLDQILESARSLGAPILEIDSLQSVDMKAEQIADWIANY